MPTFGLESDFLVVAGDLRDCALLGDVMFFFGSHLSLMPCNELLELDLPCRDSLGVRGVAVYGFTNFCSVECRYIVLRR